MYLYITHIIGTFHLQNIDILLSVVGIGPAPLPPNAQVKPNAGKYWNCNSSFQQLAGDCEIRGVVHEQSVELRGWWFSHSRTSWGTDEAPQQRRAAPARFSSRGAWASTEAHSRVEWLAGWLVDWLTEWMEGWVAGKLTGWPGEYLG